MHLAPKILMTCAALAAIVSFSAPAHAATVVVVGTCKSGVKFSTIGAAIAATSSVSGATIDICPGTYPEQLTLTQSVTLLGIPNPAAGSLQEVLIIPPAAGLAASASDIFGNPVAAQIFAKSAGTVIIQNLTVDGTGNNVTGCGTNVEGIYFQNTSGKIIYNTVRNQYQSDFTDYGGCQGGLAINVESPTTANSVTITSNSVRSYQKNGITATGAGTGSTPVGPSVAISSNFITGLGSNALNWGPNPPAAENGIQVGFGATGSITNNYVSDDIWPADTSSQPYNAASGILVYASNAITITGNTVSSTQFGITVDSDSSTNNYGTANNSIIENNKVSGTQIFDAIDACSSVNTISGNSVYGSTESGIHLDDSCSGNGVTSGNSNTVSTNNINEACAGVLLGGGSGNTVATSNIYYNVGYTTLAGDTCTPPTAAAQRADAARSNRAMARPSPYKPLGR